MPESLYPYWKRNLAVLWISQFFVLGCVSMSLPFAPYFLRELTPDVSEERIRFYAALSAGITQVTFAIAAPLWGYVADRVGRKKMLLRAVFGASAALYLMGNVHSVTQFMTLRFMQGLLSGTMSASMTLLACSTPPERQGFALGMLTSSFFTGDVTGLFMGGLLAEHFGYRNSFHISGMLMMFSVLLVFLGTKEKFKRAESLPDDVDGNKRGRFAQLWRVALMPALPIFALYIVAAIARFIDGSQLALFVEELHGGAAIRGKDLCCSMILGAGSLGAMLSGFILSRFIDKCPERLARTVGIVAGTAMLAMAIVPFLFPATPRIPLGFIGHGAFSTTLGVLSLMPLRFILVFASGGMEPICHSLLAKVSDTAHRGLLFGYAQSCRAIGQCIAHGSAGVIAPLICVRAIYIIGPFAFLLFVIMAAKLFPKINGNICQNTISE